MELERYELMMERIMHQEMKEEKKNKLEESVEAHITMVDNLPFHIADDDPVLLRKEQEAIKSFYETPWPEEVLKRIVKGS
ncbi:MAG TPA: hypothetical protein VG101_05895 [Puia sp.]|jgi:hypothetical protein|nr:hypothetical protein [Puia sp.]